MMRLLLSSLFLLCSLPLFSKTGAAAAQELPLTDMWECFFHPPKGWECSDPHSLSSHVKIAFFKKSAKGFCPSINLSIEKTSVSLNEYLKAVRAIHERDRANQWRSLGKVRTAAGLAQLTEIDSHSEYGPIRILQLILMKQANAYILTAAALKEEFPEYYEEFQTAFRSLTMTNDLISNIPQLERRETLKKEQSKLLTAFASHNEKEADSIFQKEHWLPFEALVVDQFQDMGPHWQTLLLRSTKEHLQHMTHEGD
jgi:hypothetical protein